MSNSNSQHLQMGEGARADAERDRGGEGEARVQDGVVPRAAEGPGHHALAGRQFNRHFWDVPNPDLNHAWSLRHVSICGALVL